VPCSKTPNIPPVKRYIKYSAIKKKCPRARSADLIRDDSITRDTIMCATHAATARARDTTPEIAYISVVGSIDRPATAPPRSRARGGACYGPRAPREMAPFIIYTFSTVCMEWHDGRTTRSKDARMVIEPPIRVC
jgi:hypothetical protein